MNHHENRFRFARLASACALLAALGSTGVAIAQDVPGHPQMAGMGECTTNPLTICRVAVPNGDFAGGNADAYSHAGFMPALGPSHSIADHIAPWEYVDGSGLNYAAEVATAEPFVLRMPGDGVRQVVRLPAHDDAGDAPISYHVHAHVGSYSGVSTTRMDLALMDGESAVETASLRVEHGDTRGDALSELVTTITVPAGTNVDALSITLTSEPGEGRVPVADVFVVRAPDDAYISAMQPRW